MAEPRNTMIEPPIEVLLDQVDSKFTLVTLSSKRGRQINSYFNQLGEGLGAIVPPQVASIARKPLSIALEEIAAGKVQGAFPEPDSEQDGEEGTDGFDAGAQVPELLAVEITEDVPEDAATDTDDGPQGADS
jgi:DNA-directed RNA polymerase subunit omega